MEEVEVRSGLFSTTTVEDLSYDQIAFRFQRTGKTLPTSWTYPEIGEFEGAQVWSYGKYGAGKGGDFGCVMQRGGNHPDWDDGFSYGPDKYPQVAVLLVDGFSGEKGPLSWRAVTEQNVNGMWILDHRTARQELDQWVREHEDELEWNPGVIPPNRDFCGVDDFLDYHPAKVLARLWIPMAEKVEPDFSRTVSGGLVNS